MYPIVIERPPVGVYNLKDEIDKACKKVVEMGLADPQKDLLTVTAGTRRELLRKYYTYDETK